MMTTYKVYGFRWEGFEIYEEFEANTITEAIEIYHQFFEEGFHQIIIENNNKEIIKEFYN